MIQWLRGRLPVQEIQIQSLVVKIKIPHAPRQLSPGIATKTRNTLINILNTSISIMYIYIYESVLVAQSCSTLCNLTDSSPPGSSVHGVIQARILKWVTIPFSKVSDFPNSGSNPGLFHCRQILYSLSHHGSPKGIEYL